MIDWGGCCQQSSWGWGEDSGHLRPRRCGSFSRKPLCLFLDWAVSLGTVFLKWRRFLKIFLALKVCEGHFIWLALAVKHCGARHWALTFETVSVESFVKDRNLVICKCAIGGEKITQLISWACKNVCSSQILFPSQMDLSKFSVLINVCWSFDILSSVSNKNF